MRKKRIGTKRRSVYPYDCLGGCGKHRIAFDHERAKAGVCAKCEKPKENPDQGKLFLVDTEAFRNAKFEVKVLPKEAGVIKSKSA